MFRNQCTTVRKRPLGPRGKRHLLLEILEARTLPASISPLVSLGSNLTLDQAQSLGDLTTSGQARVLGTIGDGSGANGQVNWYSFTLDAPAKITLATANQQISNPLVSALSLYNTDSDSTQDPYVPLGYRLLAQDDGASHGGDAAIVRSLSAGTYYVAVSGSGDRYFHPSIANSGYPAKTGNYDLSLTAQSLSLGLNDGPVVLATDLLSPIDPSASAVAAVAWPGPLPAVNATINRSPQIIRVDFSGALDPTTVQPGQNVQFLFSPNGGFGNQVAPISVNAYFDATANELKLTPSAPLAPGYYKVFLSVDGTGGAVALADASGNALGQDATHPAGQDYTFVFQLTGLDGATAATDDQTPAGAHDLGDITQAGLVQAAGAIGDNPADPVPFNPADIDLYHFRISSPGSFAFQAEVFAGRIGSPLDPEASLFRLDPADNQLHLLAVNDNTLNDTRTFNGILKPLNLDSSLIAGLTQGDYYVAVTGSGYVPAQLSPQLLPTPTSVFDPSVPHPAGGSTIGDYVLNVAVQAENAPPQVVSVQTADGTALKDGAVLTSSPTGLSVDFSEPVNLTQLARDAVLRTNQSKLDAVFITGLSGVFYPRYTSASATGDAAAFLMYDALPNGAYELHLSGGGGLTNWAGLPLAGTSPSGDYVIHFTVNGPARGSSASPLTWVVQGQQNLGVLFPNELLTGVRLQRNPVTTSLPPGSVDNFQIQLLQSKVYKFILTSKSLPRALKVKILDSSGNPVRASTLRLPGGIFISASLSPGTYTIQVQGWSPAKGYTVTVSATKAAEPIPPLTVGPRPSIRIVHVTDPASPPSVPTPSASPPVVLNLPASGSSTLAVSLVSFSASTPAISAPTLSDIPSGIFLALAPGPMGGISSGTAKSLPSQSDVYDRVLAQAPGLLFTDALVQLPILIQTAGSGTQEGPTAAIGFGSLIQGIVGKLDKFDWTRIVEFFYRFRGSLQPGQAVSPQQDKPSSEQNFQEESETSETESGLIYEERSANARSGRMDCESILPGAAEALVLAAAVAVLSPRKPRDRGKSRREGPIVRRIA